MRDSRIIYSVRFLSFCACALLAWVCYVNLPGDWLYECVRVVVLRWVGVS